ncbi:MAG: tRNA (N(6)-L-threonylcarbamoyladenosine(37)-C(2))-methylthiotransferase MtaB [Parasporobacterium sp.]|nr:tRNA (N(6)-L-threonylcarbamoyladenosine(37)-C(2))-methylthiotransferase MtaB [Parasporobacterium sp.]
MKAAFHTLGCKTNAYETQAVKEQFLKAGYEIGDFSESCDVYVINTCAVTKEAARKSRQMAGRCKRKNPDAFVVVTGCYAQEAGEELLSETMADLVVGNSEKSRIVSLVQENLPGGLYVRDLRNSRDYETQEISEQEGHVRAYVKIQDGCDRFCTYCLIPYLRGRSRSRGYAQILKECQRLASAGYQEIVLTGIDISSFRITDPEESLPGPGRDLARLISQIERIGGIRRIRLGSLEAGIISEELIQSLKEAEKFCPQFHLSLQSGCDSVLRRMNRHYTTKEYEQTVGKIREIFPEAAVTTDIITGFPGESEEEFAETVAFAERIGFSRLHVFPYSRREGTRADRMPDQLSKAVKEDRAARLIAVGEVLRKRYETRLIGKKCEILAEECICRDEGCFIAGYTPEYVRVLIPAEQEHPERLVNQILEVIPTDYRDGTLFGRKP